MGVDDRERGVVADRADVAQMIGDPLELGHDPRSILARGGGSICIASSTARAKAKL